MDLIQEKERLYGDDFDLYFGANVSKLQEVLMILN